MDSEKGFWGKFRRGLTCQTAEDIFGKDGENPDTLFAIDQYNNYAGTIDPKWKIDFGTLWIYFVR